MERTKAISSRVIVGGKDFSAGVLKHRNIREISRGNGRKKASFLGVALGFKRSGRALRGGEGRN